MQVAVRFEGAFGDSDLFACEQCDLGCEALAGGAGRGAEVGDEPGGFGTVEVGAVELAGTG